MENYFDNQVIICTFHARMTNISWNQFLKCGYFQLISDWLSGIKKEVEHVIMAPHSCRSISSLFSNSASTLYIFNCLFNIDLNKKNLAFNSSSLEVLFLVQAVSWLLPDRMMHLVLLQTETLLFSAQA